MEIVKILLEKQLKANEYSVKSVEMSKEVSENLFQLQLIGLKFKSKHSKLLFEWEKRDIAECEIIGYYEPMKSFQVKTRTGYSYLSHTDMLIALNEGEILTK